MWIGTCLGRARTFRVIQLPEAVDPGNLHVFRKDNTTDACDGAENPVSPACIVEGGRVMSKSVQ